MSFAFKTLPTCSKSNNSLQRIAMNNLEVFLLSFLKQNGMSKRVFTHALKTTLAKEQFALKHVRSISSAHVIPVL